MAARNTSRLVQSLRRSPRKWLTWLARSASIQARLTVSGLWTWGHSFCGVRGGF
jgi:hypothetical protein